MYARKVTMKLKPGSAIELSRLYEREILPVLRQQPGFKDGMTLVSGERAEAVAISLWDNRQSADTFTRTAYQSLVALLEPVLAEPVKVSSLVLTNSTPHRLAVRV